MTTPKVTAPSRYTSFRQPAQRTISEYLTPTTKPPYSGPASLQDVQPAAQFSQLVGGQHPHRLRCHALRRG